MISQDCVQLGEYLLLSAFYFDPDILYCLIGVSYGLSESFHALFCRLVHGLQSSLKVLQLLIVFFCFFTQFFLKHLIYIFLWVVV